MMDTLEIYIDAAEEWRWRRQAPNGQIISVSGEGYTRRGDAEEAARRANPDLAEQKGE